MVTSTPSSKNLLNYKGLTVWKGKEQLLMAGPAWTLFYTLSDHFGFDMEFQETKLPGHWNGTHWAGSLGCVVYQDCDVDIYSMFLMIFNPYTLAFAEGIQFQSLNTWVDGFAFVCTPPKEQDRFWNLIRVFPSSLWMYYLVLVVGIYFVFMFISGMHKNIGLQDNLYILDNLTVVFRILVGRDLPEMNKRKKLGKEKQKSRNVMILMWSFCALLFLWFFQCNLKGASKLKNDFVVNLGKRSQIGFPNHII